MTSDVSQALLVLFPAKMMQGTMEADGLAKPNLSKGRTGAPRDDDIGGGGGTERWEGLRLPE